MSRERLLQLADLLGSNKIKDRTDAVTQLEDVNFNSSSIANRIEKDIILKLIDSLSHTIEIDKNAYSKSNINGQLENRLFKASNILKIIISNVVCAPEMIVQFKNKQYESVLDGLTQHIFYRKQGSPNQEYIFDPVALNCINALNSLFHVQNFKDHIFKKRYKETVSICLQSLELLTSTKKFTLSSNEVLIASVLSLFYEFLRPCNTSTLTIFSNDLTGDPTDNINNYYLKFLKIMLNYSENIFQQNRRESECLVLLFKIMNSMMIDCSNVDIKTCHRIYKIGVKFLIDIKAITLDVLQEQVVIFINLIPDFINLESFPTLLGDNWNINERGELVDAENGTPIVTHLELVDVEDDENSREESIVESSSNNDNVESSVIEDSLADEPVSDSLTDSQMNDDDTTSRLVTPLSSDKYDRAALDDLALLIAQVFDMLDDANSNRSLILHADDVILKIFPHFDRNTTNWFNSAYLGLAKDSSDQAWLARLGLGKLLESYFTLKSKIMNSNSEYSMSDLTVSTTTTTSSRKRRRLNNGLNLRYAVSDNLNLCHSLLEFIIASTESGTPHIGTMISCLQLYLLRLSEMCSSLHLKKSQTHLTQLFKDCNGMVGHLLKLFDLQDNSFSNWVLISIYLILSAISNIQTTSTTKEEIGLTIRVKHLNKLLKYSLEFLKSQSLSKSACMVLCSIIQAQQNDKISLLDIDPSIIQQYETIIDISEINGPALVGKESVVFWFKTFELCKIFKFKNIKLQSNVPSDLPQLFSSKVFNWLLSKSSQLETLTNPNDIDSVSYLLSWAMGANSVILEKNYFDNTDQLYSGSLLDVHFDYKQKSELKDVILLQLDDNPVLTVTQNDSLPGSQLSINPPQVNIVITKLLSFVEEMYNEAGRYSKLTLYGWSFCCLNIYAKLKDVPIVSSFVSPLNSKISVLLSDNLLNNISRVNSKTCFNSLITFIELFNRLTPSDGLLIDLLNSCVTSQTLANSLCEVMRRAGSSLSRNLETSNAFDAFVGSIRKENRNEVPDDAGIYNFRTLNRLLTPEQKIFEYLLKSTPGSIDPLQPLKSALGFAVDIGPSLNMELNMASNEGSAFKVCACFFTLLRHLSSGSCPEIDSSTFDLLIDMSRQILESHKTKTSELSLVISCRFLPYCAKYWYDVSKEDWERKGGYSGDLLGVYEYMQLLAKKNMFFTELGNIEYLRMMYSLMRFMPEINELFSKSLMESSSMQIYTSLNNFGKFSIAGDISLLLKDSQQPIELYNTFIDGSTNTHGTIEGSAMFTCIISKLSSSSEIVALGSLCNLLQLSRNAQFKSYIASALREISTNNEFESPLKLFWNFKEIIFRIWKDLGTPFQEFPYELFNFKSYIDFIHTNYKELTALYLAFNDKGKIHEISTMLNMTKEELVKDSISLAIPLAWCSGLTNGIFEIFDFYFSRKHATKQNLKEQAILIASQLLKYCDTGNESVVVEVLKVDKSSPYVEALTQNSVNVYSYAKPYHMVISPRDCFKVMETMLAITSEKQYWNLKNIYFLSSKLLILIESTPITIVKLLHIRRIKALMLLSPEVFSYDEMVNLLVSNLAKYLDKQYLTTEVGSIFKCLLLISKDYQQSININTWIPVLFPLVDSQELYNSHSDLFSHFCSALSSQETEKSIYMAILKGSINFINFSDSKFTVDDCVFFLMNYTDGLDSEDLIKLLTLLFNSSSEINSNKMTFDFLNDKLASRIYNLQLGFSHLLSSRFAIWIAKSLGEYYLSTGKVPLIENLESNKSLFTEFHGTVISDKVGLLDSIFSNIIKGLPKADISTLSCFNRIAGVIISKHMNNDPINHILSYESLFQSFESYVLPFSYYACSIANDDLEINENKYYSHDLLQVSNVFPSLVQNDTFENWTRRLFFALVNAVSEKTSLTSLLALYASHVPSFAASSLSSLILHYIIISKEPVFKKKPEKLDNIVKLINTFFSLDLKVLSKDAIELFLELVLLIRIGKRNSYVPCVYTFGNLDHPAIFHAALSINKSKTALMLLEEYYTEQQDFTLKRLPSEDIVFLEDVYSSIDVSDLRFGLPVRPTLEYGLNILRNSNGNWATRMFDNASFEVSLATGQTDFLNETDLVSGMLKSGLTGISKMLDEYSGYRQVSENNGELNDIVYERCWKLSQWDLPVPSKCSSENAAIYKTLKTIVDLQDDPSIICERNLESMITLSGEFLGKQESLKTEKVESWFRTLASMSSINEILLSESDSVYNNLENYHSRTEWFKSADFTTFENILLSRKAAFEIICSSETIRTSFDLSADSSWLGLVNEVHDYCRISRDLGYNQKSVNFAVYLSKIASFEGGFQSADENLQNFVNRISKFNMASAFWAQEQETMFPVATISDIIEKDGKNPIDINALPFNLPKIPTTLLTAIVAKWCFQTRQKTPDDIMNNYINPIRAQDEILNNIQENGEAFHIFAKFCDEQLREGYFDTTINKLTASTSRIRNDMIQLDAMHRKASEEMKRSRSLTYKEKKKDAKRSLTRLKITYDIECEELSAAIEHRKSYVNRAIAFYLRSIASGNDADVDRFCALWLENSTIYLDDALLFAIPTYNFIPWVNQLTSRLLDEDSHFQRYLKTLILNMSFKHPFHTGYLLRSLCISLKESSDPTTVSRGKAASWIWEGLIKREDACNVSSASNVLTSIASFADHSVSLANKKFKQKKTSIASAPDGNWWVRDLPSLRVPPPSISIKVQRNGTPYDLKQLATIYKVNETITIAASGVSEPKILKLYLSSGESHRILLKGGTDDLRQDAIMEQVFEKVNLLLEKDAQTRRRSLRIRTYKVVPLGPGSGIIEFVANTMALNDILQPIHSSRDTLKIVDARRQLKEVENRSPQSRLKVFRSICAKIRPCFRVFFFNNFLTPDSWFESRLVYTHGVATTSIIGHILGLGDRHCNNVLIDKSTGEPVHIDLGVAFDHGKSLPIPETVPFRLTRDILDGLGITGVQGLFSKSCEHVFRVLRENDQYINGILDVLRYDPLYSWALSPLRKKRLQDVTNEAAGAGVLDEFVKKDTSSEASIAIEVVKSKLDAKGLSSEAVVRELIREATDESNLAVIFNGWSAFL